MAEQTTESASQMEVHRHPPENLPADSDSADSSPTMSQRVRELRLHNSETHGGGRAVVRRGLFWLVCLGLLAGGVFLGASAYTNYSARGLFASSEEVDAIRVTAQPASEIVLDASGYVIAHSKVKVSPSIPGTIVELRAEEGQKVNRGDVLARLDDTQYRADLDHAGASLALAEAHLNELTAGSLQEEIRQAKAQLQQARLHRDLLEGDFQRAEQLKDTISTSEYDRVKAVYQEAEARVDQLTTALQLIERGPRDEQIAAARAEVESAKALVAKAQYFLDCTEITAPIAGTVIERTIEMGERTLPESLAAGVLVIADLTHLEAEIDVQEQDLADIRVGQSCLITPEADVGREYHGRLDWLSPVMNRQRGTRQARARILGAGEELLPDMNCRVKILAEGHAADSAETITIPKRAIANESGQTVVYVLDEQVARRRVVEIGDTRDDRVQIRRGLRSGEVVLLPRDHPLKDGQAVRPLM